MTAGYHLGAWQRGEGYARRAITNVIRFMPVIGIAMAIEYRVIPWAEVHNDAAGVVFSVVALLGAVGLWINFFRWIDRDRFGPAVLELIPTYPRLQSSLALIIPLMAFILTVATVVRRGSFGADLPWIGLLALSSPVYILAAFSRIQFRKYGMIVSMGISVPRTHLISYSWQSGGGRLEGQYDILFMRFRGGVPTDFKIPVGHREALNALLEQQAFEWPS